MTITELKDVDEILSTFDGETRELVIDHLPASTHDRAFPFVHETGKRYLVLNLCKKTLNEAARKAGCP